MLNININIKNRCSAGIRKARCDVSSELGLSTERNIKLIKEHSFFSKIILRFSHDERLICILVYLLYRTSDMCRFINIVKGLSLAYQRLSISSCSTLFKIVFKKPYGHNNLELLIKLHCAPKLRNEYQQ